jgi:hypothetical protein
MCRGNLPAVPGTIAGHRIPCHILHNLHLPEQDSHIDHPDYECPGKETGMLLYVSEPADLRR